MKYMKTFEGYNDYNVAMSTYRTYGDDHLSNGDVSAGEIVRQDKDEVEEIEDKRMPKDREKERRNRRRKEKKYKEIDKQARDYDGNDLSPYMTDKTPGKSGSPSMQSAGIWSGGSI